MSEARNLLNTNRLAVNSTDLAKMNLNCAHIAVIERNFDMLKLLVEFGVDLEAENKGGMTPIFFTID